LTADDLPTGRSRLAPWLGLAGLGALWLASRAMAARMLPPAMVASVAAGLLLWVLAAWIDPSAADPLGELDPPAPRPRVVALVLSLLAAAACWWRMPMQEFRWDGVAAWWAAVLLWLVAWWPSGIAAPPPALAASGPPHRWLARAGLVLIVAVAAGFLFHDLAGVPSNPVSDHAEEMLDLRDLMGGRAAIYFFRNLGIAPFHFYWNAAFLKVLGLPVRYVWLKAATASFGLLLIPAVYAAGVELGGTGLGLAAAAFAAWGKWPVSLARQGQEYDYAVPFAALVVWALLRWMRRGDRRSLLWAGIGVGLGLTTYTSFRVVPLLVPLAVAVALFDRRRRGRRWKAIADGLFAAATSILVFLPVLKYAFFAPQREYFWARVLTRATDAEQAVAGRPLVIFASNLLHMARAFHWKGSSTWTVLVQFDPFLDAFAGALLLAGVVLLFRRAAGGAWRWTWFFPALFVLTLPSTLVIAFPDENPSLNRADTAIPLVFLLVGLPFAYLWTAFWRERFALRVAGLAALCAGAAVSARENARSYFVALGTEYDHVIEHSMEIAAVIRRNAADGIPIRQQYLLAVDYWVDGRNIALDLDDPQWADTNNIAAPKVPQLSERPLVFIYRSNDTERLATLERLYPGGRNRVVPQSHPDRNFSVYVVR
jgi:hypothetical protein